jgi:hypothetical protein
MFRLFGSESLGSSGVDLETGIKNPSIEHPLLENLVILFQELHMKALYIQLQIVVAAVFFPLKFVL